MEDDTDGLFNSLMANDFVLTTFMAQVSIELAQQNANPKKWAEGFVSNLHSQIDKSETVDGIDGRPIHELARQRFDRLGHALFETLSPPQE